MVPGSVNRVCAQKYAACRLRPGHCAHNHPLSAADRRADTGAGIHRVAVGPQPAACGLDADGGEPAARRGALAGEIERQTLELATAALSDEQVRAAAIGLDSLRPGPAGTNATRSTTADGSTASPTRFSSSRGAASCTRLSGGPGRHHRRARCRRTPCGEIGNARSVPPRRGSGKTAAPMSRSTSTGLQARWPRHTQCVRLRWRARHDASRS